MSPGPRNLVQYTAVNVKFLHSEFYKLCKPIRSDWEQLSNKMMSLYKKGMLPLS